MSAIKLLTNTMFIFSSLRFFLQVCVLLSVPVVSFAQTFTTVASGNWTNPAVWQGGIVPSTASPIPISYTININHSVTYNLADPIDNNGFIRIQTISPAPALPAGLRVPSGVNIFNRASGRMLISHGKLVQCRFSDCSDGPPSGPPIANAGQFSNEGGIVTATFSVVEIAQDWTNNAGGGLPGRRFVYNSCVRTGQNFGISDSQDDLRDSSVSVGWHGSGNISSAAATVFNSNMRYQLAGTSGSFSYASGTAYGSITFITLKNHVTNVAGIFGATGGGSIVASSSLNISSGLVLTAYFTQAAGLPFYEPNGKFSGPQTYADNTSLYFPDSACSLTSNPLPPPPVPPFSCNALYGSYSNAASTTFDLRSINSSNGASTDVLTTPPQLTGSRGNAAAITPGGQYYFYRLDGSNNLMRYDGPAGTVFNTGQAFSAAHNRMAIEPGGVHGYAASNNIMQRFLVASPHTIVPVTITNVAPAGFEYTARTGGDIAFDRSGIGWVVAKQGGATPPASLVPSLYRLEFSTSTASVTATYYGAITSSNATFTSLDINGTAFATNTFYIGGSNTALGSDAAIWRLDFSTRQAILVGNDTANSNDIPVTDLASCHYPPTPLLPANLSVTKTNGTTTLIAGQTTAYTITFSNAGPYPVYNALVLDTPSSGLSNCNVSSCAVSAGSACPSSFANFVSPSSGVLIPSLTAGGSVTVILQCSTTATGL